MKMNLVFLTVIILQAVHSLEEYAFHFYERFPLAEILNDQIPGLARSLFIAFNVSLLLFGLLTYWLLVRGKQRFTRAFVGIWAGIELYNGLAHLVWAISIRDYSPGLVSAPFLLFAGAYLVYRLYGASPIWNSGADA